MALPVQYFVNAKTRLCNVLSGRGPDHEKNIKEALDNGFVEVTVEGMDSFRAETAKAIALGWNPSGRVRYSTFMKKLNPQ